MATQRRHEPWSYMTTAQRIAVLVRQAREDLVRNREWVAEQAAAATRDGERHG